MSGGMDRDPMDRRDDEARDTPLERAAARVRAAVAKLRQDERDLKQAEEELLKLARG